MDPPKKFKDEKANCKTFGKGPKGRQQLARKKMYFSETYGRPKTCFITRYI
jgi:hypothetical protein